jgi:hypothetical protein
MGNKIYYNIMTKHLFIFVALLIVFTNQSIYQKYYQEAYNVAVAMTLDQKIGQILQVDFNALTTKNGTDPI